MSNKSKPVVVTVNDDAMPHIHDVAKALGAAGLKVGQVMPLTGVITGHFPGKAPSALQGVKGVASVELDQGVQLPPPDAGVQ